MPVEPTVEKEKLSEEEIREERKIIASGEGADS